MAPRHGIAVAIKEDPGERAQLARWWARMARGSVFGEPCLNRLPDRLIDNWPVFAGTGLPLVDDLAEIDPVLQYQVERTAREGLPPIGRPEALVRDLLVMPQASNASFNNSTEPSSA